MIQKNPLNYALFLLKIRDRSCSEIEKKMISKGFTPDETTESIKILKEKSFLDDDRFVDNYIRSKQNYSSSGKYKIKHKLQQLGIDKKLLEQKIDQISPDKEIEIASSLADNWLLRKQSVLPEKKYEKLGRFLISKGFEINMVREILDNKKREF